MLTHSTLRRNLLVLGATTLLSTASMAYVASPGTLPAQPQSDVAYVTGGIGDEDRAAVESVAQQYNVHITSATKDGAYSGATAVVIYDRKGNELLVTDAGPLLYVSLPPGRYTVAAEYEGAEQTKKLNVVKNRNSDLNLLWN